MKESGKYCVKLGREREELRIPSRLSLRNSPQQPANVIDRMWKEREKTRKGEGIRELKNSQF
jgi:hypothetical protein